MHRTVVSAIAFALLSAIPNAASQAGEAKVAVAANFTEPSKEIAQAFEKTTGHKLVLSFGATGQFYAQITQGAPFEILLSADKATPVKAVADGHAVSGTAFTYAIGKLVLYSKTSGQTLGEQTLKDAKFSKIAIANPATAPYGAAGMEVLKTIGALDALQSKIVQGNNIGQTFQFIDTGNAEVGFVALSQVAFAQGGSRWIIPASLYSPIAQDAVLLKQGAGNDAAKAFLAFLQSSEAIKIIEKFGYAVK